MVQFGKGEKIRLKFRWKNLADKEQTYGVGAALIRPDGSIANLPLKSETVPANSETTTVWRRKRDINGKTIFNQAGNYYTRCKIWNKTEPPLRPENEVASTGKIDKITVKAVKPKPKPKPTKPVPIKDIVKIAGIGIGGILAVKLASKYLKK